MVVNVLKVRQIFLRSSGKGQARDGKGWQGMALKAKGLKALTLFLELTLKLVATRHPPPPTASLNTLN